MAAALFLLLWYGLIGTLRGGVHPDLTLRPSAAQLPAGGSVTAAMAARLIEHEVDEGAFTPNDPFFFPTGFARRTPAYQTRIVQTVHAAVDALARETRPPNLAADLKVAAAELAIPADQWWLRAAWPPIGASAERHYRRAAAALVAHNRLLAEGRAVPSSSPPGARMDAASAAALASLATAIEAQAAQGDRILRGTDAGNPSVQLAAARGTAFAAALLMRGLRDDNAAAIRLSGRAARWGEALDALDAATNVSPIVTRNGDLVTIGYSLLIAANAMRDILDGSA